MQFTTLLVAALAAAASAKPTRVSSAKRACQTQYPASIGFPINYNVSKTISPPSVRNDAVQFELPSTVPAGACQLIATFPAGYAISQSGASQVNFIATNGPATGNIVGTITFASNPQTETVTTINSFACAEVMAYEMEIASEDQDGWVAFSEVLGAGLIMQYGC